jgi:group I intron endonuclease
MDISGIYTITCLINNKIYVGKSKNLFTREDDHFQSLKNKSHHNYHLQKAFDKYGEKCFIYEILVECDENLLYSEEHYWCNLLNVHNRNYGYNIRPTHPEGKSGVSENTKKLISNAFKKPIIILNPRGEFIDRCESITETHNKFKIGTSTISKILLGKYKTYTKYILLYEKDYEKNKQYSLPTKPKERYRKGVEVLMYDLEGNLIREWKSLTEAANFISSKVYSLFRVIKGRRGKKSKTNEFKNYVWKYKQ